MVLDSHFWNYSFRNSLQYNSIVIELYSMHHLFLKIFSASSGNYSCSFDSCKVVVVFLAALLLRIR